jgi:multidrug efflux system outer membrane protein
MALDPVSVPAVEQLPEQFDQAAVEAPESLRWWADFQDETLNELVDLALESNLDVVEAVARVEEVRAQYRIGRAPLLPTITAGVDASRFSQPANAGQFGAIFGGGEEGEGDEGPSRFSFSTFGASLGFAYELDFWGRLNSGRRAALADFMATGADLQTIRISIAAETIAAYFELRELQTRQQILESVVDILAERGTLTEGRYQRGVATSIELYQIQQDLNATRAGLPLLGSQITAARGRLALLLGRYPHEVDELLQASEDPAVSSEPIPAGLPSEMLAGRPDLQASALRLEASRQRVGERVAARFPSISLTGSTGTQSGELADLLRADQWFTNLITSLTAPIFSGGRLKAEQQAAEARYEQEAVRYARSVLTAFQEVDASLAAFDGQRQRKLVLDEQLLAAEASSEAQLRRVELGVGDYVGYLDALRTLLNVRDTQASAERDLATARLNVHRALGGTWVAPPTDSTETDSR